MRYKPRHHLLARADGRQRRCANLALLATLVVLSACASGKQLEALQASIDRLGEQQAEQTAQLQRLRQLGAQSQETLDKLASAQQQQQQKHEPPAQRRAARDDEAQQRWAVPLGDSPQRGALDAWVTLVLFSEHQCPFCARVEPTLTQLLERFPDELRLVYKHRPLPFHQQALPAALAAACAGRQGLFWELSTLLFKHHKSLDDESLARHAASLPVLDQARWRACVSDRLPQAEIEADMALALALGAQGVPSFYINGRKLSGAQPLDFFVEQVELERARAQASGFSRELYYEQVVMIEGRSVAAPAPGP